MLTLHTFPLEPATLAALNDCQTVNRLVSNKFFPNLGKNAPGHKRTPRDTPPIRFRLCLPEDALGTPGLVTLLIRSPLLEVSRGVEQKDVPLADGARVRVRLALGPNLQPAGEKGVHAWVKRTFANHGMEASKLRVSGKQVTGMPGRTQFTSWDVTADIAILNPTAAQLAFADGMGSGRDYGFGLIIVEAPEATEPPVEQP